MTRPMFPPTFDSTLIGTLRSCPRKFSLSYMEHWKPQSESVHLLAGGAFARGLEIARREFFELGQPADDAMATGLASLIEAYGDYQPPEGSAKTLERMMGAFEYYFEQWPLGHCGANPVKLSDNRSGIEFAFAIPLPINHPVSGEPILYTGRTDMLCHFADGIYIEDDKTTSSLGASWSKQWELRSQFTGYCWAVRETFNMMPAGALIRGVSILKTKYDHQQVISPRLPWELDRWFEQTCRDIRRAIKMWEEGYWDYNLDHSCAEYGGCQFMSVCKSPNPETWLPMYFEQRVWDPLARAELSVAEWEAEWAHCKSPE